MKPLQMGVGVRTEGYTAPSEPRRGGMFIAISGCQFQSPRNSAAMSAGTFTPSPASKSATLP